MADNEKVENLILGGGEPGKYIAWELARQGRRTIVVERTLIGGSCPNIACLPSKNVVHNAKVADFVRRAADYGQRIGPAATDMAGMRRRKREAPAAVASIIAKRAAIHSTLG
jgi:pyruvate/2-oxoglutarate dehydrogenase complex dihydrolipoamide dehydrogenase (E3) component